LILSLSTSGSSPAFAARLRRMLEGHVPENIEQILAALAEVREILKSDKPFSHLDSKGRGELLKKIANDDDLLAAACHSLKEKKLDEFILKLS
jgi:siroheme synthase (precorrin-2 oxidase/ferrochelatase)